MKLMKEFVKELSIGFAEEVLKQLLNFWKQLFQELLKFSVKGFLERIPEDLL